MIQTNITIRIIMFIIIYLLLDGVLSEERKHRSYLSTEVVNLDLSQEMHGNN